MRPVIELSPSPDVVNMAQAGYEALNPVAAQGSQAESADLDALHALERALAGLSLREKALLVGDEVEPLRMVRGA